MAFFQTIQFLNLFTHLHYNCYRYLDEGKCASLVPYKLVYRI